MRKPRRGAGSRQKIRRDKKKLNSKLKPLLERLEKELFVPGLDAAQLRLACGIKDRTVGSEFGRAVGVPLRAYMEDCRLETAVQLLRHQDLQICEISELLGYARVSSFSRAFKRWSSLQPGDFRRLLQADSPLASVPGDELLTSPFWYAAMLGELDTEQRYHFCRHVQALYPQFLQLATRVPENDSEPPPERIDGRQYERFKAAEKWQEIADLPQKEQRLRVLGVQFRTPEFFDLLLRKSREEGRKDRQRGVEIALLALDTVDASTGLLEGDTAELHARAWAWVGNAHRLALNFSGAEQAFDRAELDLAARFAGQSLFAKAEISLCRAGLRLDQRRFEEAGHKVPGTSSRHFFSGA